MSGFYVGIADCGCVRAALIDDDATTPKEVAEFARRQQKMKRRMSHVADGIYPWTVDPDCAEHKDCLMAQQQPAREQSQ